MKDFYEILGVEKVATLPELRSAYHKLALKHHPDRNKGSEESEEKFREISAAYSCLSDERLRKLYDHERSKPPPRMAPGGQYDAPPPPDIDSWFPKRKYEAVKNSYFYQHGERRRAQNQQSSFRPGSGIYDPFSENVGTGIQAPIELGKPVPIVGTPPVLGQNVNIVQGGFGSLPGFFMFRKSL